jgi:N-acetylmuramoyl-L-alanine amidase
VLLAVIAAAAATGLGQAPPPPASWTVLSKDGRQPLVTTQVTGREMVAVEELTRLFGVEVREDPLTRGLSLTLQGRTIVVSPTTGLASIGGRVVTLSTPPQRAGRSWVVPVDIIEKALTLVHQPRLDVRPRSHLVIVGDLRVPRVTVRVETQPALARVVFDITPAVTHTVVQEPGRLLLRIDADALDVAVPAVVPGELLTAIRPQPAVPTIAIETGPRFATFRATASPAEASPQRLTIELVGAPEPTTAAPAPGAPGTPAAPGAPAPAPAPPLVPDGPVPAIRTVVIDPGHGGKEDGRVTKGQAEGARGPGGTYEKHVTLAVARLLRTAIEQRLGLRVLMTREDDRTLVLDERAAFANNNKADLFISLHANASVASSATGAEVFYLSLDGYSPEARRVAMQEGAVLPSVTGGDRQIEIILWEMAQLQHLEQSAAFAGFIEQALRARVKMSNRAIQQAPFRVLVGANMPAVLVELGFISNPEEEKRLNAPPHQQQLVDALVESIVKFRAQLESQGRDGSAPATRANEAPAAPAPAPPRMP